MHHSRGIAEEDIISNCKSGSLKYQELLYKRFYGYAMGISLRYSFSKDDALEAVNDAFIKVFNALASYNSDRPFKAWLRTIVVNTSIDRRRKDLKHQLNVEIDHAVSLSSNITAVEHLELKELLALMKELPPLQLTIFNLFEIDGYSHDEIAQTLSISVSSSRVYLSRAKEKLRNILRSEAQNHG